jgi:signal transduction histidine kinase
MNTILLIFSIISLITAILFIFLYLSEVKKHKTSQKMQNEFMAVMIHDLRSPLSVIKSSADLILQEARSLTQEQIADLLKQMEGSASDLLNIVSNLLDVSKIEAGKIEVFKQDFDINKFLQGEVSEYSNLAHQKGLAILLELDSELKAIKCDGEKLKHLIGNLISNALKFTETGSVTIITKGFRNYVQVSIDDTGPGIPDELKKKLFNKFTQAQRQRTKEQGTGLGLVIAKGIVEAHGGRIWIEDNKPQGSRFIFTIPS